MTFASGVAPFPDVRLISDPGLDGPPVLIRSQRGDGENGGRRRVKGGVRTRGIDGFRIQNGRLGFVVLGGQWRSFGLRLLQILFGGSFDPLIRLIRLDISGNGSVGTQGDRVANLAAHLFPGGQNFDIEQNDDLLSLQIVANIILDLNDGERIHFLVGDFVVHLCGQHGERVGIHSVRNEDAVPVGRGACDPLVTQDLKLQISNAFFASIKFFNIKTDLNDWIVDLLISAYFEQRSFGQIRGHFR